MAIPRRLLAVAVSAVAAGAFLYVSSKMKGAQGGQRRSPVDEANDEKDSREKEKAEERRREASVGDGAGSGSNTSGGTSAKGGKAEDGARKELSLFLAGEAWHDEIGWQALWEKEAVSNPDAWLRSEGKSVLGEERAKLTDHPALLAGCRRRWIVVCRYAGIDVADTANIWNG